MIDRVRIIDGDGHIQEDSQGIVAFLPDPYREMALETPRSVGLVPPVVGLFPPLDHLHTSFRHSAVSFTGRGRVGPPEWLGFLDEVGIERTVLYPTAGLSCGRIPYPEVAVALARAYNDWLHSAYIQASERFGGIAVLPMQVPEAAVEELRRAVEELGFLGALLPSNGLKGHLGSREYWPVFEEASRLGCCLSVHGGNHLGLGIDHLDVWQFVHALGHPLGQMIALAGMVANAVFDRYPDVRVAFLEGGVSWFLTCLERFDSSWASFRQVDPDGRFPRVPAGGRVSDYVLGHVDAGRIFVGCEGDELGLAAAVRMAGSRPFVFSSDFPHEVTAETCREEIDELLDHDGLADADKEAILHRNAARLYRLA
jgi:predicted TIM-barrel fold metal-dependent hydrolase